MGTWKSRGLRGSTLEEMINHSNELYREKEAGADSEDSDTDHDRSRLIKAAATSPLRILIRRVPFDYIGTVQGIPVCFDAKECAANTFPLQNVHEHQVKFMQEFEQQGGIAFLIIHFIGERRDLLYDLPGIVPLLAAHERRRPQELYLR